MKYFILTFILCLFLSGCSKASHYQKPEEVTYSVEGDITNREEIDKVVQVLEDNLYYAQIEDIDGYVSTIVSSGHEETKKELLPVFSDYDLEHTILNVEVIDQTEEQVLVRTEQQTIMIRSIDGIEPYRNHIEEANHTLIKEKGEWKIIETIITNMEFIE